MIYRFRSRHDADVLMTRPVAERILAVMGKDVTPEGILQPAQMPAALDALRAAVEADDAVRAARGDAAADADADARESGPGGEDRPDAVSLRRRVWPLVEMIQRARAHDDPVTWHA